MDPVAKKKKNPIITSLREKEYKGVRSSVNSVCNMMVTGGTYSVQTQLLSYATHFNSHPSVPQYHLSNGVCNFALIKFVDKGTDPCAVLSVLD